MKNNSISSIVESLLVSKERVEKKDRLMFIKNQLIKREFVRWDEISIVKGSWIRITIPGYPSVFICFKLEFGIEYICFTLDILHGLETLVSFREEDSLFPVIGRIIEVFKTRSYKATDYDTRDSRFVTSLISEELGEIFKGTISLPTMIDMGTDHERFITRLIKSSNKDEILQVILITDSNGGPSQVMMGCCDRYSFKNLDFAIEFLKRKLMEGFFFKEVKSFIEYL